MGCLKDTLFADEGNWAEDAYEDWFFVGDLADGVADVEPLALDAGVDEQGAGGLVVGECFVLVVLPELDLRE